MRSLARRARTRQAGSVTSAASAPTIMRQVNASFKKNDSDGAINLQTAERLRFNSKIVDFHQEEHEGHNK